MKLTFPQLTVKIALFAWAGALSAPADSLAPLPAPSSTFPYLLSSALLPGSGQYLLGHKVKGPFVLALEAVILSSGINDGFYLTGKWDGEVNRLSAKLQGPFETHDHYFLGAFRSSDSLNIADSLDQTRGELEYARAIRDRTLAWGAGFHLYNVLDCYQYIRLRKGLNESHKSGKGALLRSLTLPGWGQYYNGEYSKLGLLMMSVGGFGANVHVWNRTADFYRRLESESKVPLMEGQAKIQAIDTELSLYQVQRKQFQQALSDSMLAPASADSLLTLDNGARRAMIPLESRKNALQADNATLSSKAGRFNEEKKRYLSLRNQNIWYLFAVYMYAAFDALVDAHLHDFNSRLDLAFIPSPGGPRFGVLVRI